jgi:hypothetical protein
MPDDLETAWEELFQMWEMGIEAVRTGIVRDSLLLVYADTLGIQFFQELPVAHAPAGALVDTLSYMEAVLDSMFVRAAGHPSARHFGLARYADTSTPEACPYFEALAGRVRQQAGPESRVYYAGAFIENDQCAGAVDFVLLDVRNVPSAVGRLRQWTGATPVGVAALGSWVDDGSLGLRTPHSPASQARYLEQQLTRLLAPDGPAPVAGRAAGLNDWVKLEVIGDERTLLPDVVATVDAARTLVAEGFHVLAYTNEDVITALRLEDAGCAAVMPLASPIGSGLGLVNPYFVREIKNRLACPVIVDAGVGTASDACITMEQGVDGILMNTAIAQANNPIRMARAMKLAVEAGRLAWLAGRMPRREVAVPSSPTTGMLG